MILKQHRVTAQVERSQESASVVSLEEGHLVPPSSFISIPEPVISAKNVSIAVS